MSLVRAFTTRRAAKTTDVESTTPRRNLTTKRSFAAGRPKISAPLELLSTTNMLSYNAPDIFPGMSSASSSHSGTDSENSISEASSPPSSPEPSNDGSPIEMKENHLSCYFGAPSRQSNLGPEAPIIPKRAPSHNKKDSLARSMSRISSGTSKTTATTSTARSSINMFTANPETEHIHASPFDSELAQVSELAEEFGIDAEQMAVVDEEEQELMRQGFFSFRAEDYMSEIQGLFTAAFGEVKPAMAPMWF